MSYKEHGPFAGWTPLNCTRDHILWRNADGRISFWTIADSGNSSVTRSTARLPGWTAMGHADRASP